MVLGWGLGEVANSVADPVIVPYGDIPQFPQSTVEGHSGRLLAGQLGGCPVVILQGRVHAYEGYSPGEVTFPMRVLGALGIRAVVLTNAAGGIQQGYEIGQLVAIADHINLMGFNPLTGPNEPRFAFMPKAGLWFFDMTEAYSKRLRKIATEAASEEGFDLAEGIYLATPGPTLRLLPRYGPFALSAQRWWGCHRTRNHRGPAYGSRGARNPCVTNLAAGLSATPLSHTEVFEAGRRVEHRLAALLKRAIPRIARQVAGEKES